jgi:hypothetical protein
MIECADETGMKRAFAYYFFGFFQPLAEEMG